MKASWNGIILAESNNTIIIEGNHYFPLESINKAFLKKFLSTRCPWKGWQVIIILKLMVK